MKFRVTMKDPDGAGDSIQEAAEKAVVALNLDAEEAEAVLEKRVEKLRAFVRPWMEYGEYITIEFDTEAGTASVVRKGA